MRGSVVVALAVLALLATLVDWRLGAALQAVTIGAKSTVSSRGPHQVAAGISQPPMTFQDQSPYGQSAVVPHGTEQ